jgi:hypothetical protein
MGARFLEPSPRVDAGDEANPMDEPTVAVRGERACDQALSHQSAALNIRNPTYA